MLHRDFKKKLQIKMSTSTIKGTLQLCTACIWNVLCMFDYNLRSCKFDPIEKRLATIMVVASLFGVINYSLITQSRVGTYNTVEWYNQSMHYYASFVVDGSMIDRAWGGKELRTFVRDSQIFLSTDHTDEEWLSNANWMYKLTTRVSERAVYAQSLFIGLIMYLAVIYWGLSTVSTDSQYLTVWYRFVALPIYLGTVTFVIAVYILVQVYIDYVYCYLDGYAAILAETAYSVMTKVVIAMFALNFVAVMVSNRYAIYDPFKNE